MSQIQALDRTALILPMRPGVPERAAHPRRWSVSLTAAFCVLALVELIGIAPLHAYNLARVHRALKTTPAMAAGVADHKPTLGEIAALLD